MSRLVQLEKLLEKEPNDAFLNFGVAMELAKAGRFPESIERFDHLLTLDPHYVAGYFHKGKTFLAMDDVTGAKATLKQGIEVAARIGEGHAKSEMEELLSTI